MTDDEIIENARKNLEKCRACPVCDGRACRNEIPGPGVKGSGDNATRNYEAWQSIRLKCDTIVENVPVDTTFELFGHCFKYPFFAAPVGDVKAHFGAMFTDKEYNDILVSTCASCGIAAFTGDGVVDEVMVEACKTIQWNNGIGVPTVKPWDPITLSRKMDMVKQSSAFAVAMDIDAAGLPFLKNSTPPAGCKTVDELHDIILDAEVPFIVKGVMSAKGADKAVEAGASAIVVSNHGGRVLDSSAATADVLNEIVRVVNGRVKVLVDGGLRSGADVLKALAIGADGVLICRPFVIAAYGGREAGVERYINKIGSELSDAMAMCGVHSLDEITPEILYN
jgi:4-hydroxymandelate oxidase